MQRSTKHIDRPFLAATVLLALIGFFIYSSASLGLLARGGAHFSDMILSQLILGIGGGFICLTILTHIPYRSYRAYTPYFFGFALFLTAAVFIPGVGYEANGARRWLDVFGVSFQPAELLKVSFVLGLAWYYSTFFRKLRDVRFALGGLVLPIAVMAPILLLQPDTGTFAILALTGTAVAIAAGTPARHMTIVLIVGIIGLAILGISRPYLLDRVTTFLDPSADPRGSGYQITQSLIAVGSGGVVGRGFGQSVQKFNYLPEPTGDSIFSVAAEEFGFIGSILIIGLFVLFAARGLIIATRAPDRFGGLTVVGLVILLVSQSFINISSMIGLMPLTGEPLVFISHGGTSLLFALASVGIILNISKHSNAQTNLKTA